jgi:hypothetical protein
VADPSNVILKMLPFALFDNGRIRSFSDTHPPFAGPYWETNVGEAQVVDPVPRGKRSRLPEEFA